jgi:hypothetical protein
LRSDLAAGEVLADHVARINSFYAVASQHRRAMVELATACGRSEAHR